MNLIWSKLSWKDDYSHAPPFCFANQWISQDIVSLSSQSALAKMDIHWYILITSITIINCICVYYNINQLFLLSNFKMQNQKKKMQNHLIDCDPLLSAHLAVFLHYLISNSDPNSLVSSVSLVVQWNLT